MAVAVVAVAIISGVLLWSYLDALRADAIGASLVVGLFLLLALAAAVLAVAKVASAAWRYVMRKREYAALTEWRLVIRDALIVPVCGEGSIDFDEHEIASNWDMVILRLDDDRLVSVHWGGWGDARSVPGDRMARGVTIVTRKDNAGDDVVLSITPTLRNGAPAAEVTACGPAAINWADSAVALTPRRVERRDMMMFGGRGVSLVSEDDLPGWVVRELRGGGAGDAVAL
jgi:hypothetical protein